MLYCTQKCELQRKIGRQKWWLYNFHPFQVDVRRNGSKSVTVLFESVALGTQVNQFKIKAHEIEMM